MVARDTNWKWVSEKKVLKKVLLDDLLFPKTSFIYSIFKTNIELPEGFVACVFFFTFLDPRPRPRPSFRLSISFLRIGSLVFFWNLALS